MIVCPVCGCSILMPTIKSHETYSDCFAALALEHKLWLQRMQRVIKLVEIKLRVASEK